MRFNIADRLLPPLTKFLAFGRTIPEADAEELASDVLMTVHAKIGTFRHGGRAKLTTWIFEIAKNRAIDFHRAHDSTTVELTPEMPQTFHETHASSAGPNAQLVKWLQQQLGQFSEQDQYLLKWRALEIPYSQIAEWLGIKEGAARVRHRRAIEKLRAAAPELAAQKGSGRS